MRLVKLRKLGRLVKNPRSLSFLLSEADLLLLSFLIHKHASQTPNLSLFTSCRVACWACTTMRPYTNKSTCEPRWSIKILDHLQSIVSATQVYKLRHREELQPITLLILISVYAILWRSTFVSQPRWYRCPLYSQCYKTAVDLSKISNLLISN